MYYNICINRNILSFDGFIRIGLLRSTFFKHDTIQCRNILSASHYHNESSQNDLVNNYYRKVQIGLVKDIRIRNSSPVSQSKMRSGDQ